MKLKMPIEHYAEHRVIALLGREQVDFLDRLGKDALFSTGTKLSRTKIISSVVDLLMGLHINGKGVRTEEEFEEKVKAALKENLLTKPPKGLEAKE